VTRRFCGPSPRAIPVKTDWQRSLETFERARILYLCRHSLAEIADSIGAPLGEFAAWFRALSGATVARPNAIACRLHLRDLKAERNSPSAVLPAKAGRGE
jgi:hypothetical protein